MLTLLSIMAPGQKQMTQVLGNTNQYKDVIAQREFSASEARQRVKSIVTLRLSSLTLHRTR